MAWTKVSKPEESSVTTSVTVATGHAAQPFGVLIAITSVLSTGTTTSVTGSSITTGWTDVTKPTASVGAWTNVTKPT